MDPEGEDVIDPDGEEVARDSPDPARLSPEEVAKEAEIADARVEPSGTAEEVEAFIEPPNDEEEPTSAGDDPVAEERGG